MGERCSALIPRGLLGLGLMLGLGSSLGFGLGLGFGLIRIAT